MRIAVTMHNANDIMGDKPQIAELADESSSILAPQESRQRQLRLIPVPKPLNERFGRDFFLRIPRCAGVYRFYGEFEELLYVGKSKNLRDRLNSYRNVHPDRDSRKTIRLVHRVRRIEWKECSSHEEAVLLENELLRTLRPFFNRANTWPRACLFVGLLSEKGRIGLRVTRDREEGWNWFGAFKPSCIRSYAAMVRLLHLSQHLHPGIEALPLGFFSDRIRRTWYFERSQACDWDRWSDWIRRYLTGESEEILAFIELRLQSWRQQNLLAERFVSMDLERLRHFFVSGCLRVRRILESEALGDSCVSPERLLDHIALESTAVRFETEGTASRLEIAR